MKDTIPKELKSKEFYQAEEDAYERVRQLQFWEDYYEIRNRGPEPMSTEEKVVIAILVGGTVGAIIIAIFTISKIL